MNENHAKTIGAAADASGQTVESPHHDIDRLRRYLLGELPEPEADELEAALLEDRKDLFLLAEAVEADLLDDYAEDRLTPVERRRLEGRVLATRGGRERLHFARALAARAAEERANRKPARLLPFRQALRAVAAMPARYRAAAAAMAAGVLLAAGLWLIPDEQPAQTQAQTQTQPQPKPKPRVDQQVRPQVVPTPAGSPATESAAAQSGERAPDRTPPPSPAPPVLKQLVIQLALSATRGDGDAQREEIPAGTGEVELRLAVAGEFESFLFVVRDAAGVEVVRGDPTARLVDEVRTVSLTVPAALLPDGIYAVDVSGLKHGAEPDPILLEQPLEVVWTR